LSEKVYAVHLTRQRSLAMSSRSRTATIAGVFFLVTEVSAIAGLVLYQPALTDANYVGGAGADTRVLLGALCELILVVAIIGTAVTLYPVVKRQNEGVALGYVSGRLLEAAVILIGTVSVVSLVTLRQDGAAAGTDEGSLVAVGQGLVGISGSPAGIGELGGGVAEVEAAGGVESVFGGAGGPAVGEGGLLVVVVAGAVDREAPATG